MKKTIGKHEYDTQTATLIRKTTCGYYGDPSGHEESLYQTPEGLYFLYVNGGEDSAFPVENICRISKEKAQKWLEEHH